MRRGPEVYNPHQMPALSPRDSGVLLMTGAVVPKSVRVADRSPQNC